MIIVVECCAELNTVSVWWGWCWGFLLLMN